MVSKRTTKEMSKNGASTLYIMIRVTKEEHADITAASAAKGFRYPAVYARTILLADVRKTVTKRAKGRAKAA
jgi:hypothetical protein